MGVTLNQIFIGVGKMIIRCGNCGVTDVEFIDRETDEEAYRQCPECGACDCEEEVPEDIWAEEMEEDEADRDNDWCDDED